MQTAKNHRRADPKDFLDGLFASATPDSDIEKQEV